MSSMTPNVCDTSLRSFPARRGRRQLIENAQVFGRHTRRRAHTHVLDKSHAQHVFGRKLNNSNRFRVISLSQERGFLTGVCGAASEKLVFLLLFFHHCAPVHNPPPFPHSLRQRLNNPFYHFLFFRCFLPFVVRFLYICDAACLSFPILARRDSGQPIQRSQEFGGRV